MPDSEPRKDRDRPHGAGPDISQFLLHTCHDLRTVLRGIRVHAELLAKESKREGAQDFADHVNPIVDGTAKLERLANGLTSYSIACQIDRSLFVYTPLEVVLRSELARLAKDLRENDALATYDPLPRVRCDPDRIQQLFENLLRNALVHRGECAPRIHVSAQEDGDSWLFAVRDNGPGIEGDYLERVFEPFERLRGQQSPGPGLGLATCRKTVENHGGKMWAESEVGRGSTFYFTLPAEPQS
jgi:signal transduction histidine kinase